MHVLGILDLEKMYCHKFINLELSKTSYGRRFVDDNSAVLEFKSFLNFKNLTFTDFKCE